MRSMVEGSPPSRSAHHLPCECRGGDYPTRLRRLAAILGAFAAHDRAQLAMLMLVLLALGRAFLAHPGAQLEHLGQQLRVRSGAPQPEICRDVAHVGAVEAHADALAHVHVLGGAGVGAAQAHLRAIHGVMDGIAERLVDVALHLRVKADHFADGHETLAPENPVENQRRTARFLL